MTLNDQDRQLIQGALDTLGVALAAHDHVWTDGERAIYEEATALLQLPRPLFDGGKLLTEDAEDLTEDDDSDV